MRKRWAAAAAAQLLLALAGSAMAADFDPVLEAAARKEATVV